VILEEFWYNFFMPHGRKKMLRKEEYQIFAIKHMFEKSAQKYGEKASFWMKQDKGEACSAITYNELYGDVCGLGTSLITRGMRDKRIAIVGENSYEWAVSYLAAICGTGVAVPLDKELCITELKYFLNTTRCSCAIFSGELEDAFRQIGNDGVTGLEILINMDKEKSEWDIFSLRELIDEGKELVASGNRDFTNAQIIRDTLCAIMFTAGTTNVPKGVNLSHGNIATAITMVSAVLTINENDVFFSRLPAHSASECICGILLPLCRGASISYCEGLKCNFEISAMWGYGLTECASIAAINPDNGSAGRLLPEMKARIARPDPDTGIGEICLSGGNIMMGYCGNPEATAEVLKDGWLYTGDLGKIDEKGYIYISGRKENVIIAENGKNVYPEELENCLSSIPYVLKSMVWSKASDDDGAPVIAATILADEEKVTEMLGAGYSEREVEELLWSEIGKINDKLPFFKRIKKMILRKEEFQKNSSQKIMRWYPANRES
jgi:long-subunit acyl-CoA synthetase (AMP-forming)